jgi:two-component system phosphate regulon sensor histidine kinase PhoR
MSPKRSTQIIASYAVSLVVAIALLVVWVVYIVQNGIRTRELAARVGMRGENVHWVVLVVGCVLFAVLMVGITYQLAQSFAERRYSQKREELVSNVTHEMKSPVAAIKLHAQTLQQDDLEAEERQRSVRFILQQADRMGALVDDVLESSRLVARKRAAELVPLALATFCERYFQEVRPRVEGSGVRLSTEVDTDAVVLATEDGLRRVLDNLLDNAARFSSRGGEVRCLVSGDSRWARIVVEDDGIGIPKNELTKIFDRFYQIGREFQDRRWGTGLGLSIVAGLVSEMRGKVRAQSPEGRPGARFVVELPRLLLAESLTEAS